MNTIHRTAKGIAVLLVSVFALGIAAPLAAAATASRPPKIRANHHILWYHWHTSARALEKRAHKFGSKVVIGVESMNELRALMTEYGLDFASIQLLPSLHAAVVDVDAAQRRALLQRAASDPRIRYLSPVHSKRKATDLPNDKYLHEVDGVTGLPYEWAFQATHVDRALDYTKGDPNLVVGIIDTGIAYVPDLAGKINSLWTVNGTTISQVFESNDQFGHGTAVASLIAAVGGDGQGIAGYGGDVHVIGVHASIEDSNYFYDIAVAVALDKLVSLGVRIVNMSLGGRTPSDPVLVDAIHRAAAAGVLLIAAAGNDYANSVSWPAADLQATGGGRGYGIAVGASDADRRRAIFSDWGGHLTLVAPGTFAGVNTGLIVAIPKASHFDEQYPTWTDENGARYASAPGTSFAAPEVAGIAALILSARPDLTSVQVADILKQSGSRTTPDWTPEMGCGILDAGAALELATSRPASAWAQAPNTTGAVCTAFGDAPATWPIEKTQTITFDPLPNKHVGDPDFKVKAYASSGLPVTFTASGACTTRGAKIHLIGRGWCTVTASQVGSAAYWVAKSVPQLFFVAKKVQPKNHKV
jgi:subtilisin family serine protease